MASRESSHRVIAYFDVDCFYAQSEVLRRPYLQDRPVGVTQKFLVVTCNYVARDLGVPKMSSIQEAKRRCPDLVLINGEDLTPYRAASKKIMAVLSRFGILERRGLDEAALDITTEVLKHSTSKLALNDFSGHVLGLKNEQRIETETFIPSDFQGVDLSSNHLLMIGSHLVAEIRAAVEKETGFRCSSGIACNKMLAKLVSSVNKPNKQTCILASAISAYLQPLPVRKLPGVGYQTESVLKEMGVAIVADLQKFDVQQLASKLGERMAMFLCNACRGIDNSSVQNKGAPKSLSVEDSFQPCTSFKHLEDIIRTLAPDFIARLDEDKEDTGRRPRSFTVKWRYPGNWAFKSCSARMPMELLSTSVPLDQRQEIVVELANKLLLHALGGQSFALVVINIGATNFTSTLNGSGVSASHDIRSFLNSSLKLSKQKVQVVSKCEARLRREVCEKERVSLSCTKSVNGNLKSKEELQCVLFQDLQKCHNSMEMQNYISDFEDEDGSSESLDSVSCLGRFQQPMGKDLSASLSTHFVTQEATSVWPLELEKLCSSSCSNHSISASKECSSWNKELLEDGSLQSLDSVSCWGRFQPLMGKDFSASLSTLSVTQKATSMCPLECKNLYSSSRSGHTISASKEYSSRNKELRGDGSLQSLDSVSCLGRFRPIMGKDLSASLSTQSATPEAASVSPLERENLYSSSCSDHTIYASKECSSRNKEFPDETSTPTHDHFFCEKCGQALIGDAQFRQEHNDYHMALELDSQEQNMANPPEKLLLLSASSRGKNKIDKPSHKARTSLKKMKTQNGTLDYFLTRS